MSSVPVLSSTHAANANFFSSFFYIFLVKKSTRTNFTREWIINNFNKNIEVDMRCRQLKNGNIYFMDLFWASSAKKWWKRREKKKSISTVTFQEFALACATTSQYVIFFIQFREDNKQKEIFICWRFIFNDSLECARRFGSAHAKHFTEPYKIKKCEWRKKKLERSMCWSLEL